MKELLARGRWVLAAAAVAALVAFGISQLFGTRLADDPLAVAPAAAGIVLSVDAHDLTRSQVWRTLLDERGDGARRIERTCAYDPLAQVEGVIVFVFGAEERPFEHVGFVARGEMARGATNRERLVRCVGQVLAEQGGETRRVEVEGVEAMASARGSSHAAFLGADAVVGGDRDVVARTIRVARGDEPSAASRSSLRALYQRVADLSDVVLVARLPERWLPALRRMAGGLPAELDALTAVRSLAFGARVTAGLEARLVLRVHGAERATSLAEALEAIVDAALAAPGARLTVMGSALRRIRIEPRGADVHASVRLSDDLFEDLVTLWRETEEGSLGDLDVDDVPDGGVGGRADLDGGLGASLDAAGLRVIADPEVGDDASDHEDHEEQ